MRLLTSLLAIPALFAQQGQTLIKNGFETDAESWMSMGSGGSVKVVHDPKAVKSGSGALAYRYSLDGAAGPNLAILPLGAGKVAAMRRVRFWIESDHDTALGVLLSEKKPGGGDYTAMFWAPKNVWQRIDLDLADFAANDGPGDPVDADAKLDPDQVEGLGIIDLAGFFNRLPAEAPMIVSRSSGEHTLLIDDFEILAAENPAKSSMTIDRFDRGFSPWITLGGMSIGLDTGSDNPIGGPALTASIQTVDGKVAILTRRVDGARFAGAKRIAFDIAAEHEGTLALSIEVNKNGAAGGQGPRYNFILYPPEGRKVFRVNVSLADFEHDANSPEDPAGKLEAAHIKTISIGDVTAAAGGASGTNRIWIGALEMVR